MSFKSKEHEHFRETGEEFLKEIASKLCSEAKKLLFGQRKGDGRGCNHSILGFKKGTGNKKAMSHLAVWLEHGIPTKTCVKKCN